MSTTILTQTEQLSMVQSFNTLAATGILNLVLAPVTLSPTMVVATLTAQVATFTGYGSITLTALPSPYPDIQRGGVSFVIPTQSWVVGSSPTVTNTIYGGWLTTAGGVLLAAWLYPDGYPMFAAGDSLPLEWGFNFFGNSGDNQWITIGGIPV